ncbi:MAG: hypothetical protein ACOC6P_03900 [Candidatus Aminicenantaceae bacterium]
MVEWENGNYDALPATAAEKEFLIFWIIRRNKVTGVILHRYIRTDIAVKNSDGSCTLWKLVTFQQDYAGNKFQKTKFDGIGDPVKIPCENVNK